MYGNPPIDQEIILPNAEGSSWVYQKGKHFETSENPVHLCRCGHSKHKPFCDGSHKHADWDPRETASHRPLLQDAEEIDGPTMMLADNEDKDTEKVFEPPFKPSIGIIEDPGIKVSGPIWVKGGIRIEGADGKSYEVRNRVTLCRCGQSSNKPFCDGTHASMHFCDGIPLEKGKGEW